MARMSIPARGSRRVLLASVGLVAGVLFGAGALTACSAPVAPQPGLVVPAAATTVPPVATIQPLGSAAVTTTLTVVKPAAVTTRTATTHAVPRRAVTFAEPRSSLPVHRATHTPTPTTLPAGVAPSAAGAASSCFGDYYLDSSGVCVHRPATAAGPPVGATAQCQDGVYSFSQHRRGTCSGHGGVARWL